MPELRLASLARRDVADLLDWSAERFGSAARERYEILLAAALRDIAEDPARAGSREEPRLGLGRRIYHIRLSRGRAGQGSVRSPRHVLVYRVLAEEDAVVVLRVLHDAMDLVRHGRPESPNGETGG